MAYPLIIPPVLARVCELAKQAEGRLGGKEGSIPSLGAGELTCTFKRGLNSVSNVSRASGEDAGVADGEGKASDARVSRPSKSVPAGHATYHLHGDDVPSPLTEVPHTKEER